MDLPEAARGRAPVIAGAALGVVALAETVARTGVGVNLPVGVLLALCATVPLAFTGRHPLAAAVTVTGTTLLSVPFYWSPLFTGVVALTAAWYLVVRRRLARVRAEAAERDASRRAIESTLLEYTARGERARIARELHDVVAHHISMISVQAETARLAVPGMPPEGAKHLLAIGDTARTALTEMRRLLGVLREDAGGEPTRRPQPTLEQLLELIDETRESGGVTARLILRGRTAPLDPGVELTAYRIVQEALTNARRHAPGAAVDVELHYDDDVLHLRVRDNGPGPPPNGSEGDDARHGGAHAGGPGVGHGLLGMRERAATVGGKLRTGPAPGHGFLVEATLPAKAGDDR
ncbi:sensor histidine kinase [Actinomadura rudentiformis]|uniref:histidine kinase n=1 Tax=Actinomadura rudentiformis TaxID=359158 RepID=A0A6H9YNU4_9ACTN|nr:sensor histidine kinase [Actinomadura rudentiformis]KAB2349141.1 sensor histidine kinase [Actinomadura rudentiformis]